MDSTKDADEMHEEAMLKIRPRAMSLVEKALRRGQTGDDVVAEDEALTGEAAREARRKRKEQREAMKKQRELDKVNKEAARLKRVADKAARRRGREDELEAARLQRV